MKIISKIVLYLLFLTIVNILPAQDDVYSQSGKKQSNKKINTGYVFIDGKYVEPPYKVIRKGMAVYINDIKVSKDFEMPKDPFEGFDTRYGVPECLNENSTISDMYNCTEPQFDFSYFIYMNRYYAKRYRDEVAKDSLVAYVNSYPNVVSFTKISEGHCKLKLINGEEAVWGFPMEIGNAVKSRKIWGYHGGGEKQVRKEKKHEIKCLYLRIIDDLNMGEKVSF